MLTVLDLFSGIGGMSLGLERTGGFRTVAFCEQNEYAVRVLRKHWPDVPVFGDVRTLGLGNLTAAGIANPDVVCGGFPCQDISAAGGGAGLDGERSGLWFEMLRIIADTRPAWCIIENVSILRSRGLDTVLRGLAALGYDAEWHCVPAAAVGAPHRRDRVWIVAYPNDSGQHGRPGDLTQESGRDEPANGGKSVANAREPGLPVPERETILGTWWRKEGAAVAGSGWWSIEPDVGRVAHGVPSRVDRLKCLGNAVVPQIPEILGRAILARQEDRQYRLQTHIRHIRWSKMSYVEDMRVEANKRRDQAETADDAGLKRWLLSRAAFFDRCAEDAEKDGRTD